MRNIHRFWERMLSVFALVDRNIARMLVILSIVLLISGCVIEIDTKVKLVEGSSPPTFLFSGNGAFMIVVLFGPYEGDYGKDGNPKPIWEVNTMGGSQMITKYSPFTYGKLQKGLYQRTPENGEIPVLEEGKEYHIHVEVAGANGGDACFRIESGRAVSCR
jgi:hypothetical protein